jgi:hypothetical protein
MGYDIPCSTSNFICLFLCDNRNIVPDCCRYRIGMISVCGRFTEWRFEINSCGVLTAPNPEHIRRQWHSHVEISRYQWQRISTMSYCIKRKFDYTANEFRLQGSESRHWPHLHTLSPNIKTSVHTIHQIKSFTFLPLQLEKTTGWKMLRSQQVLDCCALTWLASFFFYPCRVAGVVFLSGTDCQHILQNVRLL